MPIMSRQLRQCILRLLCQTTVVPPVYHAKAAGDMLSKAVSPCVLTTFEVVHGGMSDGSGLGMLVSLQHAAASLPMVC